MDESWGTYKNLQVQLPQLLIDNRVESEPNKKTKVLNEWVFF